jgi:hypothetical protein
VGGNGGSGVVILRVSSSARLKFSSGVAYSIIAAGTDMVYTVTATSTDSETVTIG